MRKCRSGHEGDVHSIVFKFRIPTWWCNINFWWYGTNSGVLRSSCPWGLPKYHCNFSHVNGGFHCCRHKSPDQYVDLQWFDTNWRCVFCEIQLFLQILEDFLKIPKIEICMLWKWNFDFPNWFSPPRALSFLARAELEGSSLRPGFLVLEDWVSSCCLSWGYIVGFWLMSRNSSLLRAKTPLRSTSWFSRLF